MDALGYQFMALGNHDYEYTAANTQRLQGLVRFPMRGANAIVRATGQPFLGDPTLIVTVGGVRVGLLALTYHNTDQTTSKENTKDLEFHSGIDVAGAYIPELRRRADVVVVVSHQGRVVDSLLGVRVPGIDIIVGGHSHDRIQPPRRVGGAWMVQALSDASALGELTVTVTDGHVARVDEVVHELYADQYQADTRFAAMIDSMRAPYRDTLETVIATAADRIGRHYKSESPVDVLAARLLRDYGRADAAFLPGSGFGVTIQPGPITREMVVGLFPHSDECRARATHRWAGPGRSRAERDEPAPRRRSGPCRRHGADGRDAVDDRPHEAGRPPDPRCVDWWAAPRRQWQLLGRDDWWIAAGHAPLYRIREGQPHCIRWEIVCRGARGRLSRQGNRARPSCGRHHVGEMKRCVQRPASDAPVYDHVGRVTRRVTQFASAHVG